MTTEMVDPAKVIFSLAQTLSVEKTAQDLGTGREQIRQALLAAAAMMGAEPEAKAEPGGFTVRIEGTSRGNPGPAAAGVAIYRGGRMVEGVGQFLGRLTRDQAEYNALIIGLTRAQALGAREVQAVTGSKDLLDQMSGEAEPPSPIIAGFRDRARSCVKGFDSFSICLAGQGENAEPQRLAGRAIQEFEDDRDE